MVRLVILLAVAAGVFLVLRWFTRTPPRKVARILKRVGLWTAIGGLTALAATGRLNWIFAALAATVPLAQRLMVLLHVAPYLKRLMGMLKGGPEAGSSGGPRASTVTTRFLRMALDHESGALSGEVLEGPYRGRSLESLRLEELTDLLTACRANDPQSAALLEAYLDRVHGSDWRARTGAGASDHTGPSAPASGMTREQACEILGLSPGATPEEVRAAHRRLMQKLHPDRGGSDYLAAMINRAKDVLLKE
jgi:hypothetical protein